MAASRAAPCPRLGFPAPRWRRRPRTWRRDGMRQRAPTERRAPMRRRASTLRRARAAAPARTASEKNCDCRPERRGERSRRSVGPNGAPALAGIANSGGRGGGKGALSPISRVIAASAAAGRSLPGGTPAEGSGGKASRLGSGNGAGEGGGTASRLASGERFSAGEVGFISARILGSMTISPKGFAAAPVAGAAFDAANRSGQWRVTEIRGSGGARMQDPRVNRDRPRQGQRDGGRNDWMNNRTRVVVTAERNVAECCVDPLHPSPTPYASHLDSNYTVLV